MSSRTSLKTEALIMSTSVSIIGVNLSLSMVEVCVLDRDPRYMQKALLRSSGLDR